MGENLWSWLLRMRRLTGEATPKGTKVSIAFVDFKIDQYMKADLPFEKLPFSKCGNGNFYWSTSMLHMSRMLAIKFLLGETSKRMR